MSNQSPKTLCVSKLRIGSAIFRLILNCIVIPFIVSIITSLLLFIPVIGWVIDIIIWLITLLNFVFSIIDFVKKCCSNMTVTDQGVYGKIEFSSFNLTYDQIESVDYEIKSVIIRTNIPINMKKPNEGTRSYGYFFKNSQELHAALKQALDDHRKAQVE